jgi:hypothetical protein
VSMFRWSSGHRTLGVRGNIRYESPYNPDDRRDPATADAPAHVPGRVVVGADLGFSAGMIVHSRVLPESPNLL